jgi:hypothetical protein
MSFQKIGNNDPEGGNHDPDYPRQSCVMNKWLHIIPPIRLF